MRTMRPASTSPLVVIGDSLLDVDVSGTATRLCPGEPAPVLEGAVETLRPGGAALAAVLAAGQRDVVLVTALGRDGDGERLRDELDGTVELIDIGRAATVVKTRIMAGGRTLARLDRGDAAPPAFGRCDADRLRDRLRGASGVLASDYGLGILGLPVMRDLLAGIRGQLPVVWDPHPRGPSPVPGATLVTPNEDEAATFSEIPAGGLDGSIQQARRLAQIWDCEQRRGDSRWARSHLGRAGRPAPDRAGRPRGRRRHVRRRGRVRSRSSRGAGRG